MTQTKNNLNYLKIRNNWSISESPWNNGFPCAISANIHPIDQTSIGQPYRCVFNNTSGALYHKVTTWNNNLKYTNINKI